MVCRCPCLQELSNSISATNNKLTLLVIVLLAVSVFAQEQSQPSANSDQTQTEAKNSNITIPAGTHLALVLTQPVQTRYTRRGDDVYAQVTSPVDAENQVVIPPGTFVQGTVDKVERNGGRGELRLQSMAITFPDGYVTPISGPITLETTDGYAIKDPGSKRGTTAILLPIAGAGLGALIGHSAGSSETTVTSSVPPGCSPSQFGCLTSSMPVPGTKGRDAVIGAAIGGAAGMAASIVMLTSSRHFYLDAGAPIGMTLQQSVTLPQDEVAKAVRQSQEHTVAVQPVAPRPMPPPAPTIPVNQSTCYTPGTPGTPPTVIPGAPGPNGIPGPPTIIPGTPATPPYPCP
jgi:hypothetical protein